LVACDEAGQQSVYENIVKIFFPMKAALKKISVLSTRQTTFQTSDLPYA
jgi:hypothetical protein